MAANIIYEPGYNISVVASYPASPVSGGVCIYGDLTGIAETDENATTGETTVNFGPWIADLSVTASIGAIAKGDPLFASKADPVVVSNNSAGVFLGYANEAVDNGDTTTIEVIQLPTSIFSKQSVMHVKKMIPHIFLIPIWHSTGMKCNKRILREENYILIHFLLFCIFFLRKTTLY